MCNPWQPVHNSTHSAWSFAYCANMCSTSADSDTNYQHEQVLQHGYVGICSSDSLRLQAEAERRLGQAKRAAPAGRAGPSPSKRHRPAAVSSDEELSDQDGEPADPGV